MRIQIIYNPDSGRRQLRKIIPEIERILVEEYNYIVDVTATEGKNHGKELANKCCQENYDLVIAAGGDGTINEVLNGLMANHKRPMLAIYPAGTVNDFATHLKIPKNTLRFCQMIHEGKTIKTDVGLAGSTYFLNVAAAGLLTDVAHQVSSESKTVLGKLAYYLEGIKILPKQLFEPITVDIQIGNAIERKEILFFVLANSQQVGGFKKIASEAEINDGLMDLILVENSHLIDAASLFFLILQGKHINHGNITYLQVGECKISCEKSLNVDIDGEMGEKLPIKFKVVKEAVKIIIPNE